MKGEKEEREKKGGEGGETIGNCRIEMAKKLKRYGKDINRRNILPSGKMDV